MHFKSLKCVDKIVYNKIGTQQPTVSPPLKHERVGHLGWTLASLAKLANSPIYHPASTPGSKPGQDVWQQVTRPRRTAEYSRTASTS
ncbi:hypothetical protein UPYG_G00309750 [Umbra pygmaea]|uniref:Uncharacterized protein n=1 Tax=Umbra pygmaea TaxID=75934 RepID=A0ABD0W0A7_UMBPY